MEMVKVRNITDHAREVRVGIRHEGPWATVGAGDVLEVRSEVAYGWPADEEQGLPAMGGLLDQEDNWALADESVTGDGSGEPLPDLVDDDQALEQDDDEVVAGDGPADEGA